MEKFYKAIDLPSHGIPYPGKDWSSVRISPMTGYLEEQMAGAKGGLGGLIDFLLRKTLDPSQNINPADLTSNDRFYLLFALRNDSYGDQYSFQITCDNCGKRFKDTVQAPNDLAIKELPDDATPTYWVTLPVSKKKLELRYLTGKDEAEIVKKAEAEKNRGAEGDPSITRRMATMVVSIDAEAPKMTEDVIDFLRKASVRDTSAIRKAIQEHDFGIDTTIRPVCKFCEHQHELALPLQAEFFRSE